MGHKKFNLWDTFKSAMAILGWHMFLWGNDKTAEEYWAEITEQVVDYSDAEKPVLHIYLDVDQFFAALPDFVDLDKSPAIWLSDAVMSRFVTDNVRGISTQHGKETERIFLDALGLDKPTGAR